MIGGKKKRKRIKSMRACSKGNKIRGDKNQTIKKYEQREFYRKDWIRLNKNKNKNLFRILLLLFVFFSSWIREREEEEEGESEKNREGGRKERERGEGATHERINNAVREERGEGTAELYVSKGGEPGHDPTTHPRPISGPHLNFNPRCNCRLARLALSLRVSPRV